MEKVDSREDMKTQQRIEFFIKEAVIRYWQRPRNEEKV
jgi:hypothetical protein